MAMEWKTRLALRLVGWGHGNDHPDSCCRGHRLEPFRTPIAGYWCSNCRQQLPAATVVQACRPCDFDLCTACFSRRQGHSPAATASAWLRHLSLVAVTGLLRVAVLLCLLLALRRAVDVAAVPLLLHPPGKQPGARWNNAVGEGRSGWQVTVRVGISLPLFVRRCVGASTAAVAKGAAAAAAHAAALASSAATAGTGAWHWASVHADIVHLTLARRVERSAAALYAWAQARAWTWVNASGAPAWVAARPWATLAAARASQASAYAAAAAKAAAGAHARLAAEALVAAALVAISAVAAAAVLWLAVWACRLSAALGRWAAAAARRVWRQSPPPPPMSGPEAHAAALVAARRQRCLNAGLPLASGGLDRFNVAAQRILSLNRQARLVAILTGQKRVSYKYLASAAGRGYLSGGHAAATRATTVAATAAGLRDPSTVPTQTSTAALATLGEWGRGAVVEMHAQGGDDDDEDDDDAPRLAGRALVNCGGSLDVCFPRRGGGWALAVPAKHVTWPRLAAPRGLRDDTAAAAAAHVADTSPADAATAAAGAAAPGAGVPLPGAAAKVAVAQAAAQTAAQADASAVAAAVHAHGGGTRALLRPGTLVEARWRGAVGDTSPASVVRAVWVGDSSSGGGATAGLAAANGFAAWVERGAAVSAQASRYERALAAAAARVAAAAKAATGPPGRPVATAVRSTDDTSAASSAWAPRTAAASAAAAATATTPVASGAKSGGGEWRYDVHYTDGSGELAVPAHHLRPYHPYRVADLGSLPRQAKSQGRFVLAYDPDYHARGHAHSLANLLASAGPGRPGNRSGGGGSGSAPLDWFWLRASASLVAGLALVLERGQDYWAANAALHPALAAAYAAAAPSAARATPPPFARFGWQPHGPAADRSAGAVPAAVLRAALAAAARTVASVGALAAAAADLALDPSSGSSSSSSSSSSSGGRAGAGAYVPLGGWVGDAGSLSRSAGRGPWLAAATVCVSAHAVRVAAGAGALVAAAAVARRAASVGGWRACVFRPWLLFTGRKRSALEKFVAAARTVAAGQGAAGAAAGAVTPSGKVVRFSALAELEGLRCFVRHRGRASERAATILRAYRAPGSTDGKGSSAAGSRSSNGSNGSSNGSHNGDTNGRSIGSSLALAATAAKALGDRVQNPTNDLWFDVAYDRGATLAPGGQWHAAREEVESCVTASSLRVAGPPPKPPGADRAAKAAAAAASSAVGPSTSATSRAADAGEGFGEEETPSAEPSEAAQLLLGRAVCAFISAGAGGGRCFAGHATAPALAAAGAAPCGRCFRPLPGGTKLEGCAPCGVHFCAPCARVLALPPRSYGSAADVRLDEAEASANASSKRRGGRVLHHAATAASVLSAMLPRSEASANFAEAAGATATSEAGAAAFPTFEGAADANGAANGRNGGHRRSG